MKNLFSFLDIFRKGCSVADVVRAKNWSALGGVLSVLLFAMAQLAKEYGYDLGITPEMAERVAFGIATVAGVFVTYATSDKVGILPAKPGPDAGVQAGPETTTTGPGDMHGNP